jgi:hypothetical protein
VSVMTEQELSKLKTLSPTDLAALGLHHVVYIRQLVQNDQLMWSVYAADGTEMARVTDRDVAFAACRQHELEPLSVH